MPDLKLRASVSYLEDAIASLIASGEAEDVKEDIPIEHHFTPNIEDFGARLYARQGFIPAGTTFTGKLHRHPHIVSLLQGKMAIVSEDGRKVVSAPHTWAAPAGSKRAFHALEDSVLLNVHITTVEDEDLDKLEEEVIAPSYTSLGLEEPNFKLLE
jgi:quercetin dioxygenase-like cupin family protein